MSVAEAAVDLAQQLVRLDTVNPGLVPGAPGEAAAVRLLSRRLDDAGFSVDVLEPSGHPGRPSLLAVHRGTGGGRTLMLNGHLDTVGVSGMADPFSGRVEGNRLYGRGSCDMKAAIAAMVVAGESAAATGTTGDIMLSLVADEEHASTGTEEVLRRLAGRLPDACLVGEPTGLELAVAHRGYDLLEVAFTGRASHSAQPSLGVNAVSHLGRFLGAVDAAGAELAAGPAHPLAGTGSLMSTVVAGGSEPFVLPATATATVERRTVPGEPTGQGLLDVERLLGRLRQEDSSLDAVATLVLTRGAWEYDASSPGAALLSGTLAEVLAGRIGRTPGQISAPYWMESALWQAAGVPTVVCGPGGGDPHTVEEWVDLDQVRGYAEALVGVIPRFVGSAGGPA